MECENVDKSVQYTSICYGPTNYAVYVCGFSKEASVIRQIQGGEIKRQISQPEVVFTKVRVLFSCLRFLSALLLCVLFIRFCVCDVCVCARAPVWIRSPSALQTPP